MKRLGSFLVFIVAALAGSHSAGAREQEKRPARPVQTVEASARILSGVAVIWSSSTPEGFRVLDPHQKNTVSHSKVKRTEANGATREILYVDFT